MPVSTATPERSFSTMRRVKTYLVRSTMETERLAALALMHAYWDMPIDEEAVIREFCAKKNRRLAFEFLWAAPRFQICLQLMCRASQVVMLLLLLITTTTGCILLNILLFLVQFGIWNPSICQLI